MSVSDSSDSFDLEGPLPTYLFKSEKKAPPVGSVRAKIAYMLILIFAGTVLLSFIGLAAHWATAEQLKDFVVPFLSAEIGVIGAVTGFYFATHEHDTEEGRSSKVE
jgi:hypothetical protein